MLLRDVMCDGVVSGVTDGGVVVVIVGGCVDVCVVVIGGGHGVGVFVGGVVDGVDCSVVGFFTMLVYVLL